MNVELLRERILSREALIGVVGLGYVGLPVCCMFANVGFRVIGVDVQSDRVETVTSSKGGIAESEPGLTEALAQAVGSGRLRATGDLLDLRNADVILIAVETPVAHDHRPNFEALTSACEGIGRVLKDGALVVVESTVAPGTVDGLVRHTIERTSGRTMNAGFLLGHCPERVMPGKMLRNLRAMSRVCGGATPETAGLLVDLYRTVVAADLDATDCLTAELVKTTENAYRDVNIAFANEIALLCEAVGGDVWKVRDLVNKVPERAMHRPGAGVGGHCIPKDPWLLVATAGPEFESRIVRAARELNDTMPRHVLKIVRRELHNHGRAIEGALVVLLGYAYLPDSEDTRNSPSIQLAAGLREVGAAVRIHDPCVADYNDPIEEVARNADCLVLMVAHSQYRDLDWIRLSSLVRTPIVIDARNATDRDALVSAGFSRSVLGAAKRS